MAAARLERTIVKVVVKGFAKVFAKVFVVNVVVKVFAEVVVSAFIVICCHIKSFLIFEYIVFILFAGHTMQPRLTTPPIEASHIC